MRCRMGRSGSILAALSISLSAVLACAGCSGARRVARVERERMTAAISIPERRASAPAGAEFPLTAPRDTLTVIGPDGREVALMRAIRDDSTGEMVATEQLDAAVVTARFRNVAERHGSVDLEFLITIPRGMHDPGWQLRFHPDMYILGDSVRLDDIVITGDRYRKAQLKGYQQYERFLSRIVDDTLHFVRWYELEVFLKRNLPEVYAFKEDSTIVSDETFRSAFGVTGREAVEHYTDRLALRRNESRRMRSDRKFRRYVKAPIVREGIRLDTVIRTMDGDFIYDYVQTVKTAPKLRKVDIVMSGEIFEEDRRIYTIPASDTITFYISSVSTLVDGTDRFITVVVPRNVEEKSVRRIDFRTGSSDIDEDLSGNAAEIVAIKDNLRRLMTDEKMELDSIIIVASASPEGEYRSNAALSYRRASGVSDYFNRFARYLEDSLAASRGVVIDFDGKNESVSRGDGEWKRIVFQSRSGGENWPGLDMLVDADTVLTSLQKAEYHSASMENDPDRREKLLSEKSFYRYLRDALYPHLRTVTFHCHLHRKGVQKDTVQTHIPDTVYMAGVEAIRNRDYEGALDYLIPYQDYNTALAYVALDRNASAAAILENCPKTAEVNYLLAILYSRRGDEKSAVECFLRSCDQNPSFIYRGNLDPEISSLIRTYDINFSD